MAPPGDATHCTLDGLGYVIVCIAGAVFLLNSSLDLNIFDQLVAHTINDCSIKTRDTGVCTRAWKPTGTGSPPSLVRIAEIFLPVVATRKYVFESLR